VLRANQMYVEPWLVRHVATRRHIEYRPGWRIGAFEQDAAGVAVAASHAQLGSEELAFDYLVGCDGARSTVRRQLAIALRGADGLGEQYFGGGMLATHVRAPALYDGCLRDRPAFHYWIGNPRRARRSSRSMAAASSSC
jgi:2-polyprenyl-6-methoxyphenol hydroxylase-like FAD-dependent oxidoreductase